jgi:catechol 2,3-dioxygenase-like lactoylglutathione lyase family enzyme
MKLVDHYPLITTTAHAACRDFYVRHFGFEVAFEASWFVFLNRPAGEGESAMSLAFMTPDHPSKPPGPEIFSGLGAILTLQVEDAQAFHDELQAAGVPIAYAVHHEPWGQIRFACKDPSGLMLDICQQVEPAAGFWDPYMAAAH